MTNGAGVRLGGRHRHPGDLHRRGAFYTIGGTVTGLDGEVELRFGSTQTVTVTRSGIFTFATAVRSGTAYAVTVGTQPAGQTCTVTNGTGT